jgi:hypothetical protein
MLAYRRLFRWMAMRTHCLTWLPLLAVLAVSTACNDSPTRPGDRASVRVTGVIRDFRSDAPVVGAQVVFGAVTASTELSGRLAGRYAVQVEAGEHRVSIDDEPIGSVWLEGRTYRGDFYVRTAGCIARYGIVRDRQTRRPVPGATVSWFGNPSTTTDNGGWFTLSLGCPEVPCIGFNTTSLSVEHPRFETRMVPIGRGFCFVHRLDIELDRGENR